MESSPESVTPGDSVIAMEGSDVGVHLSTVEVIVEVGDTLGVSEGSTVREERDQAPRVIVGVPSLSGVEVERRGEEGVSVGESRDEGEPPNPPAVAVERMDPRGLEEGTNWVPVAPTASLPLGVKLSKARDEMEGALIPLLTPLAVGGDKDPVGCITVEVCCKDTSDDLLALLLTAPDREALAEKDSESTGKGLGETRGVGVA